jgi:hypothetical protein
MAEFGLRGRLKRQIRHMDRQMKRATRGWGQTVLWYEWDPASVEDEDGGDPGIAFDDDLYDEGGSQSARVGPAVGSGRRWKAPRTVPVYQAVLNEGEQEFLPEGNYTVDRLTLYVQYSELAKRISNPTDRGAHVNDRIGYDGRIFSVDAFNPRGRIADAVMTVTVHCTEIKDDEMRLDGEDWYSSSTSPSTMDNRVFVNTVEVNADVDLPMT